MIFFFDKSFIIILLINLLYSQCIAENTCFPSGFKIGVASSAYQTEGAWNVSDKGINNWDTFTHGKNQGNSNEDNTGDIASDSYNKYKEDIQIISDIGFDYYRLSLSWARILPNGFANKISEEGVQHYKNVLDELHAKGIEPFVTIYHWDHPDVLDKLGGWTNELMVDYFEDYARIVFQEFGSRVKLWATINEPNINCLSSYSTGVYAPGFKMPGIGPYICVHNMLKAHTRAYEIYDEEFRQINNGKIGIVIAGFYHFSVEENDTESSDVAFQYESGWIAHPIFSKNGDYPPVMKERIGENSKLEGYPRSRLPEFSPDWIQRIKGTSDYFGLNHYSSNLVKSVPKNPITGWINDSGIVSSVDKSWMRAASIWLSVVPKGFRSILNKIKCEYNNPPVFITENGYSGYANESDIQDINRINYFYSYIEEMLLAINVDGCNVHRYTAWSILDSFEWDMEYKERFGIVHVDFNNPNRTRTPRLSASWLGCVLNRRKLISFDEFNANRI
ncbi:myrosinase 1-like [Aphidius gifuensis]|uniref:myrosinase 1-like n=1 Tax=Aphidius gifuensis TaxID=684658 RepID=UPI001CDCD7B2|nr:myrosinase 1-like [Aphidius gifuensis]